MTRPNRRRDFAIPYGPRPRRTPDPAGSRSTLPRPVPRSTGPAAPAPTAATGWSNDKSGQPWSAPVDIRDELRPRFEQITDRLDEKELADSPARVAAKAQQLNSALDVSVMQGNYDSFPAQVMKTYYAAAPGNHSRHHVMLKRIGLRRDGTNDYPVARGSAVAGQDDSRGFLAQPMPWAGFDCNTGYVAVGDIVTAFFCRDHRQHLFIRDDEPFIGQVTAVVGTTVTVDRRVWSGDPTDPAYAGPTFATTAKNATGVALSYANVVPEPVVAGGAVDVVAGDKVYVWRRGQHFVCRRMATPAVVSIPVGVVTAWSGNAADAALWDGTGLGVGTMLNWALCNGANGTPDLRNKFLVGTGTDYALGATGGNKDHGPAGNNHDDHALSAHGHTGTLGDHVAHKHLGENHDHLLRDADNNYQHELSGNDNPNDVDAGTGNAINHKSTARTSFGGGTGTTSDVLTWDGANWVAGSLSHGSVTVASGGGATLSHSATDNRPPYFALHWIMRVA